jgi:hypothetical protein
VCQAPAVGLTAQVSLALFNQGGGDDLVLRLHGVLLVSSFTSSFDAHSSNCQCYTSPSGCDGFANSCNTQPARDTTPGYRLWAVGQPSLALAAADHAETVAGPWGEGFGW